MSGRDEGNGFGGRHGPDGFGGPGEPGGRSQGSGQKVREGLIPRHGGYRKLKSFQISQLVYDVTVRFCEKYVSRFSRTRDQMVQVARSGVQNIAEGSKASGTSKKTELKLTNVARASLEELRLDYEDFLRQREGDVWERGDPRRGELIARRCVSADEVADWVKQVNKRSGHDLRFENDGLSPGFKSSDNSTRSKQSMPSTGSTMSTKSTRSRPSTSSTFPEITANAVLVLITVACSLLDRQLEAQAEAFEKEGGFTERLYRRRVQERRNS
jgi:four helix bundle suffix protein